MYYDGRVGDRLNFSYREYTDEAGRPSFQQDLQFDISESPVVVYRNLRLEVIDAAGDSITYKILAGFDGD
jgi:hypothetical protein